MTDRFVLCRREINDFGEAARYCAKPITKKNALNWCEGCRSRLPLWPQDNAPTPHDCGVDAEHCHICRERYGLDGAELNPNEIGMIQYSKEVA